MGLLSLLSLYLTLNGAELHRQYLIKKAGNASVTLTNLEGTSGGSGFHVQAKSGKVYIMTNKHVCELAKGGTLLVTQNSNGSVMHRNVVARYANHDLCLVEAFPDVDGLKVGSAPAFGEKVYVAGNPGLRPYQISEGDIIARRMVDIVVGINMTPETCSGKLEIAPPIITLMFGVENLCIESKDSLEVSAIAYPGSSGSATVNRYGRVVAVLYAGDRAVVNSHFLVPTEFLKDFLSKY